LIKVSRLLRDPNTDLADVTSVISFAKFIASMATFNDERAPPGAFECCEFVVIVENRGRCEGVVRKKPNPNTHERSFFFL
jgi:hypothetical protein